MRLCDAYLLQLGGGVACPLQMLRFHCRSRTSRFLCQRLRTPGLGGFTHGHLRLLLGVSLYLSFGRPIFLLFPSHSSPYSACFGMRWSSILTTWLVQRNWALISIDSMLCDSAISTTFMFEILSCHRILMIERWYLMWNYSSYLMWHL